jgi:hypothetical protein
MATRAIGLILPVFTALGVACGDRIAEPAQQVLSTLRISPTSAVLKVGTPFQLEAIAYDPAGVSIRAPGPITFASTNPAIAQVSPAGWVTAVASGTTVITATLTRGGVTRHTSMTVTAFSGDVWDVYGAYDLTARITTFDPAWGEDLTGYRYTAVLTLAAMWDTPWLLEGTYEDLRIVGPNGDFMVLADTGSVSSFVDSQGRFIVALAVHSDSTWLNLDVSSLSSGLIDGAFGCCGHIGGTFTAEHRLP